MKKAGLLVLFLGIIMLLPGCGFTEGAGATVTVVTPTPTPLPTPTPAPTPTPEPTQAPAVPTEQTASGVVVTKTGGMYTASTDVNLRADASPDAALVIGVMAGTELTGTGVYSGFISFRIDWFDLLAVQGTLKSFLEHHIQKHQFFGTQLSLVSNSHILT